MLRHASWTLIDQGVVSLGAFLLNIVLARHIAPVEYGVFALIFGILLMIQLSISSVIFYPMSIRIARLPEEERAALAGCSLALLPMLLLPAALLLAFGLVVMGRPDLALPVSLHLVIWQGQEALRRILFAEFRHRDALAGDSIAYLGAPLAVLLLLQQGTLTLPSVFFCMAAASGVALLVSSRLVRAERPAAGTLRPTFSEFWSLGRWSLANNFVGALRIQLFLWGLTAMFGAASTAAFQAALNVVNLANPILLGLCNVIPQAAARKSREGYRAAWKAARDYALIGTLPLVPCYAVLLAAPDLVLLLLYGADSSYLGLALPIRILAISWLLGYSADMVCSFMHGVDAARLALLVSAAGTLAAAALFLPLTQQYGLAGACFALGGSNLVRLLTAHWFLTRMIAHGRPSAA
ncbi:hypothetical protein [Bosea sp. WAO]|uniref:hypothetical protein n=1 Tax=Bosea sp. WAO TaxID=406341 RepID=UPI00083788C3|nr:hypothetical protein [Bosea sp. WAO]